MTTNPIVGWIEFRLAAEMDHVRYEWSRCAWRQVGLLSDLKLDPYVIAERTWRVYFSAIELRLREKTKTWLYWWIGEVEIFESIRWLQQFEDEFSTVQRLFEASDNGEGSIMVVLLSGLRGRKWYSYHYLIFWQALLSDMISLSGLDCWLETYW